MKRSSRLEEVRDTSHLMGIRETYLAAGFGVALDDVGSGYSSLNLLARRWADIVKLDMGLTRGVDSDPYQGQVAGKLLELSRDLDVRTEGEYGRAVERVAHYVQRYYFACPAAEPPMRE